jgi:arylsulfatase A-like enzyme/dienelactone hydrolase
MSIRPALLAALLAGAAAISQAAEAEKPNILVIVSDDQGYADAGFQGSREIPTPNLDRLAQSGVRCTSGYVSHPFCSPTRAGLMTGRYQQRFGHYYNPVYDPLDASEGLPLSERLLPQHLKDAGYVTGWVGKWHLGASPAHTPQRRGFDETFGFIGGGHRYRDWKPDERQYTLPIERNGTPEEVAGHLTTALGAEAASFVRRHGREPWLLYLAFNAPHTPHEPTPERARRFAGLGEGPRPAYAAQVSLMDDAVGEVLDALSASGQRERTLVFFFSDNGGPVKAGALNAPLRGAKGDVYEGGVRVPFVVSWPGRLPAGADFAPPVSSLDVAATALAAAGIPLPRDRALDGVNLLPHLAGEAPGLPHDRLFWCRGSGEGAQLAVREGRWKLVRMGGRPDELYDLDADAGESNDLAAAQSHAASRLGAALDAWRKELAPPAFQGSNAKSEDWGPGGANQRRAQADQVLALGRLKAAPAVHEAEGFAATGGLRAIYFDALPWKGKPTRVFAWLGVPERRESRVPGVVLVPGGGGTAFKEWVRRWNERGFAAVGIAVEGQTDERDPADPKAWKRHAWAGPRRAGIYGDSGELLTDQWMYHAVADTVLANSLLRSLPEVDPRKVGLMGISWGGVIASTAIGVDPRFAFAIPTYGCGRLYDADNPYGRALGSNAIYRAVWDPMVRMDRVRMPVLWLSWPGDEHFPLDAQAACYRAAPGPRMVALIPGMGHGHEAGWNPPDSYAFAEGVLLGGRPWCVQASASAQGGEARVEFASTKPLDRASLVCTTGSGFTGRRAWQESPAKLERRGDAWVVAGALPAGTTAWFANVRSGALTGSSDYQECSP